MPATVVVSEASATASTASESTTSSSSLSSLSPASSVRTNVTRRTSSAIRRQRRNHSRSHMTASVTSPVPGTSRSYESGFVTVPCIHNRRNRTVTTSVLWPSSPIGGLRMGMNHNGSLSASALRYPAPSASVGPSSDGDGAVPILVSSILDGALRKHSELCEKRANTQLGDSQPNRVALISSSADETD